MVVDRGGRIIRRRRALARRASAGLKPRGYVRQIALTLPLLVAIAALPPSVGAQAQPTRIISLVPAVTEMLFAIGAGPAVIGVSSYDRYPPEIATRQRVGALLDPDVERILALKPDLVVVYGTQQELIARLDRARIPIFKYEHAGLSDITVTMRALGERVGRKGESDAAANRIEREIDAVRRLVAGRPRPRTAVVLGREKGTLRSIHVSAGVGFLHDMLEAAGGTDVFADVKRQNLQATAEVLLSRAPDVILEVHPPEGWTKDRIERERDVWRGLPALPAVRTGRIHILADERLLVPGPRVAAAVHLMAAALHPGLIR